MDMADNPFTLMFGKEPYLIIKREQIISKIENEFVSKLPATQVYVMIGARGVGKTVLLSEIYNHFDEMDDWVVADVNPHRNILEDLGSALFEKGKTKKLFLKSEFSISFQGISFSLHGDDPVSSISSVVERMFKYLKKKNKKVLITLDEVVSNDKVKEFVHDFQSYVRKDYPVFLVMTGLYENVSSLQNDKSLTFLYRAPKILLEPLDLVAIRNSYRDILAVDDETATTLAKMTCGYGFGYQLLGHLFFDHRKIDDSLLEEYDKQLRINVYDKVFSTIGENERKILFNMTKEEQRETSAILADLGLSNKEYSVYRDRLLKKGLVISKQRGYLSLALPRFKEYLIEYYK